MERFIAIAAQSFAVEESKDELFAYIVREKVQPRLPTFIAEDGT